MKKILVIAVLAMSCVSLWAQDGLSGLRTQKQIITVESLSSTYTIQVLALKLPPSDANFFKNLDKVYEYPCNDGYVRYCVGKYSSIDEAKASLNTVRESGYNEAFVTHTKRFAVKESDYYVASTKKGEKIEIDPNKEYVVQLAAFRYPVYLTFFEQVDEVIEYRLKDKIFRYTTPPVRGSQVESLQQKMKNLGYENAFIVEYSKYEPFRIE